MRKLISWPSIATACLTLSLASCSWDAPKEKPITAKTIYYEIDDSATIVPAKYGYEYSLSGNMLARYQDFDLALVKTVIVPNGAATAELPVGTHYFYEVRSHDGILLSTFQIGKETKDDDAIFRVSHNQYHFAPGRSPGSHIIYLPYEQMAVHSRHLHSSI